MQFSLAKLILAFKKDPMNGVRLVLALIQKDTLTATEIKVALRDLYLAGFDCKPSGSSFLLYLL